MNIGSWFPISGISLPLIITGNLVKYIVIVAYSLFIIAYYVNLDFSSFFPSEFEMTVHFNDKKGISSLIKEFKIKEIDGLIISNDSLSQDVFFCDTDQIILKYLGYEDFFKNTVLTNQNPIEIEGKANFKIEKVGGIQSYRIIESNGVLNHTKYNLDSEMEFFTSKFSKCISQNDKISMCSFTKIFDNIIISPKFNQFIVINGKGEEKIEQTLYGVTCVKIFPFPDFDRTLYFFKKGSKVIPIGYAEYYTNK
jgi:hypothetical protein